MKKSLFLVSMMAIAVSASASSRWPVAVFPTEPVAVFPTEPAAVFPTEPVARWPKC